MIIDKLMSAVNVALSTLTTGSQTTLNSPVMDFGVNRNNGMLAKTYGAGFVVTVKGATSGGASTLTLRLVTSDAVGLTSPVVLWTGAAIPLADVAGKGKQFFVPMPDTNDWKRFAAFQAQAGTAVFTGGTVSVEYTADMRKWRAYPAENGR